MYLPGKKTLAKFFEHFLQYFWSKFASLPPGTSAWYGMVWYVMVSWYGMVWYGMVWYGMVWYVV